LANCPHALTRNNTLWASWCLVGPTHKVFFGGDSGPFAQGFRRIGESYGPFDLTMLEIGASDPEWADIHYGTRPCFGGSTAAGRRPAAAWGTFNLAFHAWRQPVRRLFAAAGPEVPLLLLVPG